MSSSKGIRAGKAYVELFADGTRLASDLKKASAQLKAWGASIAGLGTRIAAVGAGIVTPLGAMAVAVAKGGAELYDLARRTGMSVQGLSALSYAAAMSGTDMAALEISIYRMQKSVAGAKDDMEGTTGSLDHLGLSLADVKGMKPEDQFAMIAGRIAAIGDPTERAAAAMKVFGRSGAKLIPLLEDFQKYGDQAKAFGFIKDPKAIAQAKALDQAMTFLSLSFKSVASAIGGALMPFLRDVFTRVAKAALAVRDWAKANGEMIVTIFKWGIGIMGAGLALVALGKAVAFAGMILGGIVSVVQGVGAAFTFLGTILGALLNPIGMVLAAVAALGIYLLVSSGAGGTALTWLSGCFSSLQDDAIMAWTGISDALAAGDLGLAAKIAWLGIQMEWQKGMNAISQVWNSGMLWLSQRAIEAFYGFQMAWEYAGHAVETAMIEVTSFLGDVWTKFCVGIGTMWNNAVALVAKGINWVRSLWDSSFDLGAANRAADSYAQQQNRRITDEAQAAIAARESNRQMRTQDEEGRHGRKLDSLSSEGNKTKDSLQKEYDARMATNEKELAAAKEEFRKSVEEAGTKRAATDKKRGEAGKLESPEELMARLKGQLGGLEGTLAQAAKVSVVGTFNAAAASGLGTGNAAERTASATEATAKHTKDLLKKTPAFSP